ncbi:MAG: alpha/beta hydrolase family protein [Mycobacteriaceae bacterium]
MTGRIMLAYGEHSEQFGHLYLPEELDGNPVPVVMVVHGGFWSGQYRLNLSTSLAIALRQKGFAVWNIEYRRVDAGGGWPHTVIDVKAAWLALSGLVAKCATEQGVNLDLSAINVVGYSAGGQLALWLAGQEDLPMRPVHVVAQAGALDLVGAGQAKHPLLEAFIGTSYTDNPQLYHQLSPLHLLPLGLPTTVIHGELDEQVPVEVSRRYAIAAAAAGDACELIVIEGENHVDFLDPSTQCFAASVAAVLMHYGK